MAIVYQHTRKDNGLIFYIGIGKDISRAYEWGRNKYWETEIKEAGGYDIDILIENIPYELACEYEIYLISFYGRKDKKLGPLVNLTDGGDTTIGYNHIKETKNKIREKLIGKKLSEKRKQNIGLSLKNKKRKPFSEEWKKNMKASAIGRGIGNTNSQAKHIILYDLKGNIINEFTTILEATNKTGMSKFLIGKMCRGEFTRDYGLTFKYKM